MSATPITEVEIEVSPDAGVGQRLRAAREARKLGRDEVAAGLYLSERVIAALEEDNSTALPGPVFVQGYIRKYARLLDIPEEPLLAAYGQHTPPYKRSKKHDSPLAGSPIKPEISSNHGIVRLITWIIALGLLALVAIWWKGDMQWPMGLINGGQPATTQDAEPEYSLTSDLPSLSENFALSEEETAEQELAAPEPEVMPEEEMQSEVSDDYQMESVQDELAATDSATEIIESEIVDDEPVSESSMQELELDMALGDTAEMPSETALPAEESEPEVAAEDSTEAAPVDDAEPIPAPPIDYANSIVIEFAESCWTEIRGANGSYKLLGNMQKDERRVLTGEPPYTFVLGNSAAVTLTIKGQPFDIEAHSKGNIARFTLQAEDIPNL